MKKILAMLLCLVLVCTLMPAVAWADGETETVQLFASSMAPSENPTWDDVWSGLDVSETAPVYLYLCIGEGDEVAVEPFKPASEGSFKFYSYDMESEQIGPEAEEVPYAVEIEEEFCKVTFHGENADPVALAYVAEDGTVYGYVVLTGQIENEGGDQGGIGEETVYSTVMYQKDAVKTIGDFIYVTSELTESGKVDFSSQLEVTGQTEDGKTMAKSEWIRNDKGTEDTADDSGYHWFAIELEDGYYIQNIQIDGVESNNWWAELDYFYALYDAEGNRLGAEDVDFNMCGYISSEENIAAWLSYYFDGNENGTPVLTESYIEDLNAAIAEMTAECAEAELLDHCVMYGVEVADPGAVETIEIVTAKLPEVTGTEAKAFDESGAEVVLNQKKAAVTEEQKENLKSFYDGEKIIETMLDLSVEGELTDAVEVVIPAANASDYEVVWFKDDITPVPVATRYTADNDGVIFTAGHFSLYALVKADDGSASGGSGSGSGSGSYLPPVPGTPETPPAADTEQEAAEQAAKVEAVKNAHLDAASKLVTMKSGKKAVKITWNCDSEVDFDGVEIFRSVKRYSGYGKKPIFTTEKNCYYNTAIRTGEKYFYKVRGFVEIDGKKVYTGWSEKAWRTVR